MPVITLSIPQDLKKKMEEHKIINWSEVARVAIKKQLESLNDLKEFEKIVSKSKLTEKDAKKIGDSINKNVAKRFIDEVNNRRKHNIRGNNKK